jgi:DNA modification methylase
MIEIGRYKNLETEERLCKLCITQKIEDEYHFLIDCPIYNNSRKQKEKKYFSIINPVSVFLSQGTLYSFQKY